MCPTGTALHVDRGLVSKVDRVILGDCDSEEQATPYARMIRTVPEAFRLTVYETTRFVRASTALLGWLKFFLWPATETAPTT